MEKKPLGYSRTLKERPSSPDAKRRKEKGEMPPRLEKNEKEVTSHPPAGEAASPPAPARKGEEKDREEKKRQIRSRRSRKRRKGKIILHTKGYSRCVKKKEEAAVRKKSDHFHLRRNSRLAESRW